MIAQQLAQCTKCKDWRGPEGFNMRKDRGQPYRQCRDCMAARKWAKKNPERHRESSRAWIAANRERARAIWRDMRKKKLERDPTQRIHGRISNQILAVLGDRKKGRKAFDLVGYSHEDLRVHLERQFLKGMSWENMGEWHIDHIIPLSSFTITGPDDPELKRAWGLANLRPLWAADNIAKSDKRETLL